MAFVLVVVVESDGMDLNEVLKMYEREVTYNVRDFDALLEHHEHSGHSLCWDNDKLIINIFSFLWPLICSLLSPIRSYCN